MEVYFYVIIVRGFLALFIAVLFMSVSFLVFEI